MNLDFTPAQEAFRSRARAWLRENVPAQPLKSHNTAAGFAEHVVWEKTLHAAGWAVVSWPREYGGQQADLVEWLIFEEEYYAAGAPARVTQNGIFLLAPTLFEFGTQEQKDRILSPMAAAEVMWAQAWSEPEAGSDLANVRCRAERVDGGWKVYGQKTWCSRGAFSDKVYGLFRTDPDSTRYRGLTYMMVDLNQDGVVVRGVDQLDGDTSFAELFFDGAFVADRDLIGPVDGGWKVAMATTSSERGLSLRSPGRFLAAVDRLVALFKARPVPRLREAVAQVWMEAQSYRLYTYGTVTRMMAGGHIGADSSLNKLFWSEMDIRLHELAVELLAETGELVDEAPLATEHGRWMKDYLFSIAGPIYAGTNEVQRNIVARRVLDLPRK